MEKKKALTSKQLRERKFLLRAPLFAFPALTVLFLLMGGGRGDAAGRLKTGKGFNMFVPMAQIQKWSRLEKRDYYQQAEKDSMAARQRRNLETNYARMLGLTAVDSTRSAVRSADAGVRAVQEKLAEVKRVLAAPPAIPRPAVTMPVLPAHQPPAMDKLERLMGVLRQKEATVGADPEMAQLSSILDKLAAVQQLRKDSVHGVVAPVIRRPVMTIKALPDEDDTLGERDSAAIEAIVADEQVVVTGGKLRLELLRDILINGQRIPRGTAITGTVALSGERLRVVVTAIAADGRVYPVNLIAADEDGVAGIYIPGAPMSDAARETAEQEIGGFGPTLLSTSLAGEAAGAGVNLARSMLARKVRVVKVTVPAGYRVILEVQNQGL